MSMLDSTREHVQLDWSDIFADDAELFDAIHWRELVIDEAHRLKNKDSAMAAQLRGLRTDHTLMLTGTPLQNNTTELWALLSLLDPELFPSVRHQRQTPGLDRPASGLAASPCLLFLRLRFLRLSC